MCTDVDYKLDVYDVVEKMEYPSDCDHYDGLLVSGSRAFPPSHRIYHRLMPYRRCDRLRRQGVDQQAGSISQAYRPRETVLENNW